MILLYKSLHYNSSHCERSHPTSLVRLCAYASHTLGRIFTAQPVPHQAGCSGYVPRDQSCRCVPPRWRPPYLVPWCVSCAEAWSCTASVGVRLRLSARERERRETEYYLSTASRNVGPSADLAADMQVLAEVEVEYVTFPGWLEDITVWSPFFFLCTFSHSLKSIFRYRHLL
jgi:hypothetical protein